jgi:hypothetical protein
MMEYSQSMTAAMIDALKRIPTEVPDDLVLEGDHLVPESHWITVSKSVGELREVARVIEGLKAENEELKAKLAGLGKVIEPFIDVLKHNKYDGENAIFVERHFDAASYDLLKLTKSPDFDESEDWLQMEHVWNLVIVWLGEEGESIVIGGAE